MTVGKGKKSYRRTEIQSVWGHLSRAIISQRDPARILWSPVPDFSWREFNLTKWNQIKIPWSKMSQFKLNQYPLVSDNYWQVGLVWTILFKSLGSPTKFHSSPENSWNTFIHQMSWNRVSTLTRQEILILSFKLSICSNHSLRGLCHSSWQFNLEVFHLLLPKPPT